MKRTVLNNAVKLPNALSCRYPAVLNRFGGRFIPVDPNACQRSGAITRCPFGEELNLSSRRRGFTLMELLVVSGIVAVLAAILFPVLSRSKEKARQTSCTSNLRQLVIASKLYEHDHAGFWVPYVGHQKPWNGECGPGQYWHGIVNDDCVLEETGSPLFPYSRAKAMNRCPSWYEQSRTQVRGIGYGYNWLWIGGTSYTGTAPYPNLCAWGWCKISAHDSEIKNPAETIVFADAAVMDWQTGDIVASIVVTPPSYTNGFYDMHFRHHFTANVAFADGHVEVLTRAIFDPNNPNLGEPSSNDELFDRN